MMKQDQESWIVKLSLVHTENHEKLRILERKEGRGDERIMYE
jgi:hypothetical protein